MEILKIISSLGLLLGIGIIIWLMFSSLADYYKARDEYRRRTGKYYYNGEDEE